MTILPNSVVVASDEAFSFIVPVAELAEAILMKQVPDDFLADDQSGNPQVALVASSLQGLVVNEARVAVQKEINGAPCVRVMFIHNPNPKSTVRQEKPKGK